LRWPGASFGAARVKTAPPGGDTELWRFPALHAFRGALCPAALEPGGSLP